MITTTTLKDFETIEINLAYIGKDYTKPGLNFKVLLGLFIFLDTYLNPFFMDEVVRDILG